MIIIEDDKEYSIDIQVKTKGGYGNGYIRPYAFFIKDFQPLMDHPLHRARIVLTIEQTKEIVRLLRTAIKESEIYLSCKDAEEFLTKFPMKLEDDVDDTNVVDIDALAKRMDKSLELHDAAKKKREEEEIEVDKYYEEYFASKANVSTKKPVKFTSYEEALVALVDRVDGTGKLLKFGKILTYQPTLCLTIESTDKINGPQYYRFTGETKQECIEKAFEHYGWSVE